MKAMQDHVQEHVEGGSTVYGDELKSLNLYDGLDEYTH
jgi:hypothetical protein